MSKKILVVDDSSMVRLLVGVTLKGAGYEVVEARDAFEGVQLIAAQRDLALVICDVNMPGMCGVEMVETVKRDPTNTDLPVLMLTTEARMALVARAKEAGVRGWIVKPFKPELLLQTVRTVFGEPAAEAH